MNDRPFIPIARPALLEADAEAVREAVLSGWITQGPRVAEFEAAFAEFVGAPHACAVSNCTAALHLALLAVGVGAGDEVITASHSFIATANAIRYCGAEPVFADIDPLTFNLDPEDVEAAIGPHTRAILCVHQIGMPCDLAALRIVADRHGLALIEDAACAVGSEIALDGDWQRIGRPVGDVACFSFHPRKILTTGEGGMLTTGDAGIDARLRRLRQHGMSVNDLARHGAGKVVFESYEETGFNYRMTDIQAALGPPQVRRLAATVARRRELAERYRDLLQGLDAVAAPFEPDWARSNWQSYCVRLVPDLAQRAVMQSMLEAGIATRRAVMCAHREPAYADAANARPLPQSEQAQDRCILLPLFDDLDETGQDRVVAALAEACRADGPAVSG